MHGNARAVSSTLLMGLFGWACQASHLQVRRPASVAVRDHAPVDGPLAPPFTLSAHDGSDFSLAQELRKGPVVLVFYRGWWCPWCQRQLGELGYEYPAIASRGVNLVGVSVDTREESEQFARGYRIPFRLLQDVDGKVADQYVGLDVVGSALPGVVVIRTDGHIAFRHIGEGAADRVLAPELIRVIDQSLVGEIKPPSVDLRGGFSPLERWQVRWELGGALRHTLDDHALKFSGSTSASILFPLGRHILVGPLLRGVTPSPTRWDADGTIKLRTPLLGDIAELYALLGGGYTRATRSGWNAGLNLGAQFAFTPTWAFYYQAGASYNHLGKADEDQSLWFGLDVGLVLFP
jgi:peroxiredoxin